MKRFLDWTALADDYGRYHATSGNRWCHLIGVPLIVFCVVRWTLAPGSSIPLAAVALVLYAAWDAELALLMTGVLLLMGAIAFYVPLPVTFGLFVVGWIFQLVGHGVYEKKSPALLTNAMHLLVGPMWVLREAVERAGRTPVKPRAIKAASSD